MVVVDVLKSEDMIFERRIHDVYDVISTATVCFLLLLLISAMFLSMASIFKVRGFGDILPDVCGNVWPLFGE